MQYGNIILWLFIDHLSFRLGAIGESHQIFTGVRYDMQTGHDFTIIGYHHTTTQVILCFTIFSGSFCLNENQRGLDYLEGALRKYRGV
jgi:hypothetical protein